MTRKEDLAWTIANTIVSLKKLAASHEEQFELLVKEDMGNCADELALEFDDSFPVLKAQWEDAGLTKHQIEALSAVDVLLGRMSGSKNAHLWTRKALENSEEWKQVRLLAAKALNLLPSEKNPARPAD